MEDWMVFPPQQKPKMSVQLEVICSFWLLPITYEMSTIFMWWLQKLTVVFTQVLILGGFIQQWILHVPSEWKCTEQTEAHVKNVSDAVNAICIIGYRLECQKDAFVLHNTPYALCPRPHSLLYNMTSAAHERDPGLSHSVVVPDTHLKAHITQDLAQSGMTHCSRCRLWQAKETRSESSYVQICFIYAGLICVIYFNRYFIVISDLFADWMTKMTFLWD